MHLILVLLAFLAANPAAGQVRIARIGIVNSLKDMGLAVQTVENGSTGFNSYSLLINMDGVLNGEESWPGAKMHWCHQEIIASRDFEDFHCFFYFGGGASGGFVRDFSTLQHSNPGMMASMTADAGVLLRYRGNIDIALDWYAEIGMHLRKDENYVDKYNLSWYANGLLHCWMPCLTIYYKF